ncbi:MAG: hypothetical protein PF450_16320, partial [Bacteroidales bacterium]|nr:hypothetical protein [Bacteroidales bacterium]
ILMLPENLVSIRPHNLPVLDSIVLLVLASVKGLVIYIFNLISALTPLSMPPATTPEYISGSAVCFTPVHRIGS